MTSIDLIAAAMDRVDEWECDRFHLCHKPSGLSFWVANGYAFFEAESRRMPLGIFGRLRLWRKAKRLMAAIVAEKLSAALLPSNDEKHSAGRWLN